MWLLIYHLKYRFKEQIRLAKWGNSKAVRIPSQIIKQLEDNQDMTVAIKDGSITLTPIKKCPTNIHELFKDWQDDGKRDHELDWGESVGNEVQ
ncbi:PbsX family transcriptional regulator [Lactobacillus sp. DCY120]|uniref:PbsX family transcriptional regulator n=1 Tax=Bombilactobacillus apium TaxID=2675299 RepID=A0A850R2G1_9LACO|nr:PbsX family transcriptional regulator [Bombilactobacillus apium]NVY96530.1 PbsX family transcriptional regulator [Bombilactobacillus apium]